jgi:methylated-DNA-[protein]-cysteine S-methyltransferase
MAPAARQLDEYFNGTRRSFELAFVPTGTPFQLAVWQALQGIDYGTTASYRDVATTVGNPKATRAVGLANNRNPIALFIPCHRVIGANGSLTGYGGGLEMKSWLLAHERDVAGAR